MNRGCKSCVLLFSFLCMYLYGGLVDGDIQVCLSSLFFPLILELFCSVKNCPKPNCASSESSAVSNCVGGFAFTAYSS